MSTRSKIQPNESRELPAVRAGNTRPCRAQRGVSTVEAACMLPFLLLLLLGVVDLGQAFHLAIEVSSAARAGAQYGYQNSTTQQDTAGMIAAAEDNASDVTTWGTNTALYGCMCSDGTEQSQLATSNSTSTSTCSTPPSTCTSKGAQLINYVEVQTQATYTPLFSWPGIPSSITLNGHAMYWAGQ